jgi:hypothetical protein
MALVDDLRRAILEFGDPRALHCTAWHILFRSKWKLLILTLLSVRPDRFTTSLSGRLSICTAVGGGRDIWILGFAVDR